MKKFLVLFFLFPICFVSCTGDDDDGGVSVGGGSGPCKGVICSGHGTCYEIGDNLVSCNCEEGYVAEGIDCVLDDGNGNGTDTGSDPCAGVTCSGHGTCYEKDGTPACNCEQGYDAQGTNCVEEGSSDPCAGKDCNNHGTCNPDTGQCECEEGWRGDNCESFDNGGPWKVNVSGAVNEEIEFKYIWCRENKNNEDNKDKDIFVQLHSKKDAFGYIIEGKITNSEINIGEYKSTNNDNVNGSFSNPNKDNIYWGSNKGKEFNIIISEYMEYKRLNGTLIFNSDLSTNDGGKSINISPKTFEFKCPCIENQNTSKNECPGPQ